MLKYDRISVKVTNVEAHRDFHQSPLVGEGVHAPAERELTAGTDERHLHAVSVSVSVSVSVMSSIVQGVSQIERSPTA